MNPFAMFAQQHADLMEKRKAPASRPLPSGARPNTETETAVLDYIKAHPGAVAQDIAAAVAIDNDALYPIMQRLKRNGQVEPSGRIGNGNRWTART